MIDFSIDNQSLLLKDGATIVGDYPKKDVYYIVSDLDKGIITLYDTNGTNSAGHLYQVNLTDTNFAGDADLFRSFVHSNLGFKTTSGGSEAYFRGNSTTTQTMPTGAAGQIITIENELSNTNFIYSNGILLFLKGGFYSIDVQLHLDATSGQNAIFESWFEYSFNGQPTAVFPDSGRFIEFRERTEGMITYASHLNIVEGAEFALIGRSKVGSIDLISSVLDNGVNAPSVVVSIIKI